MRQVRTIRYREIADALRARVEAGEFGAGRLLPSEAELSAPYHASRVTVRRALELLRDEGLLDARQGSAGSWPASRCARASGAWPRSRSQLAASGIRPGAPGARVRVRPRRRRGSAPCSARTRCCGCGGSTWPTASRSPSSPCGARPSSAQDCRGPTSSARRSTSCSPVPLGGATQTIGADGRGRRRRRAARRPGRLAGAALRAGDARATTARRCWCRVHVFPAHRTEFVVDLAEAEPSIAPTGLRLVE